ncbi:MAG: hypothetical protein MZU97_19470 [Bacillus subtilis]|nr:hypothetical protein [Bacillus subtilis]
MDTKNRYGYVVKDFVRDKDSLQAMMLAVDAANYYLVTERQDAVRQTSGHLFHIRLFIYETLHNIDLFGIEGAKRINRIVDWFRNNPVRSIAGKTVAVLEDYETGRRLEGRSVKMLTAAQIERHQGDSRQRRLVRPASFGHGAEVEDLRRRHRRFRESDATQRLHSLSKAILGVGRTDCVRTGSTSPRGRVDSTVS